MIDVPRKVETNPQRKTSSRDRSFIPVPVAAAAGAAAVGIGRSGSNKLRKNPPDDPWHNRRADAEKQYTDIVVPRNKSVSGGPPRDTAFRSHPTGSREKELPVLPRDAQQYPVQDHEIERLDLEQNMDDRPVRKLSKVERLTGSSSARAAPAGNVRTERVIVSPSRSYLFWGQSRKLDLELRVPVLDHNTKGLSSNMFV